MEWAARLIGEARSRQRRRRLRLAWGTVAVLALVIAVRAIGSASSLDSGAHSSFVVVTPTAVFSQAPYLGVNCPIAHSIACDRVGLAIWLRHPAAHVTATIAGQPVVLDWFGEARRVGPVPPHSELDGYLMPAHITSLLGVRPDAPGMWLGDVRSPWPSPVVKLWITYPDRHRVTTQLRVPLNTGWG